MEFYEIDLEFYNGLRSHVLQVLKALPTDGREGAIWTSHTKQNKTFLLIISVNFTKNFSFKESSVFFLYGWKYKCLSISKHMWRFFVFLKSVLRYSALKLYIIWYAIKLLMKLLSSRTQHNVTLYMGADSGG